MARPGCGGGCSCVLLGTDCVNVTGAGPSSDPYVIDLSVAGGDNGLECGVGGAAVLPSGDADNQLTFGGDGRLFVPPSGVETLGTMAFQDADAVAITGGSIIGIPMTRNNQGGAAYTFQSSDSGKLVRSTGAGAAVFTVPLNASDAIPIDTVIAVYCAGVGGLTIDGESGGITFWGNATPLVQGEECSLRKDGANEWVRVG